MTAPGIPVVMSCVDVCLIWTTWLIVDRQSWEDGARGDARVSRAQIEGEHAGGAAEARAPNRPYGRLSATSAVTTSPAAAAAATQPRRLRPCPNHSQAAPAAAPAPRWPWRCCGRHGRSAPGGEPAGAAGRAGGGACRTCPASSSSGASRSPTTSPGSRSRRRRMCICSPHILHREGSQELLERVPLLLMRFAARGLGLPPGDRQRWLPRHQGQGPPPRRNAARPPAPCRAPVPPSWSHMPSWTPLASACHRLVPQLLMYGLRLQKRTRTTLHYKYGERRRPDRAVDLRPRSSAPTQHPGLRGPARRACRAWE